MNNVLNQQLASLPNTMPPIQKNIMQLLFHSHISIYLTVFLTISICIVIYALFWGLFAKTTYDHMKKRVKQLLALALIPIFIGTMVFAINLLQPLVNHNIGYVSVYENRLENTLRIGGCINTENDTQQNLLYLTERNNDSSGKAGLSIYYYPNKAVRPIKIANIINHKYHPLNRQGRQYQKLFNKFYEITKNKNVALVTFSDDKDYNLQMKFLYKNKTYNLSFDTNIKNNKSTNIVLN